MNRRLWLLLAVPAAILLAGVLHQPPPPSLSTPTRSEVIALAQRYIDHTWTPQPHHAFQGTDPDGIPVDTPDWWQPGKPNTGLPYKWGGFDTPESFDAGLAGGKYAGDAYSAEKRKHLDDAVSTHAVGVDCSGFVSRCWQLPRSYSTRELPGLCTEITDFSDLKPGDILNTHNRHVRLFAGWQDQARGLAIFYEASGRTVRETYDINEMRADGYQAWRYRGITDE